MAADAGVQPSEAAERGEPREVRGEQLEGGVEVGVDEASHLRPVQPLQPAAQPPVARGLLGAREAFDLRLHGVGVGVDVEAAAVGEQGPVGRVQGDEVDAVAQGRADRGEGLVGELGHGQHGGAGVDAVAAALQASGATAGQRVTLDEGDPAAGSEQVQGGRQAGESGADDHHVVRAPGNGPGHRAAPSTAPSSSETGTPSRGPWAPEEGGGGDGAPAVVCSRSRRRSRPSASSGADSR